MGITIMDMLEKVEDMPVDLVTEATLFTEKKMPALTEEDGHRNALDIEIATLILQLSPEKKREALNYLRYLAGRKES